MGLDNCKASGATLLNATSGNICMTTRLYDAASLFGIRGNEDLSNGLSAHFMLEGGFSIRPESNLAANGTPNATIGSHLGHERSMSAYAAQV